VESRSVRKLMDLKREIASLQRERSRVEGKLQELWKELEEEFGVRNEKDLKSLLTRTQKALQLKEKKLERYLVQLEEGLQGLEVGNDA